MNLEEVKEGLCSNDPRNPNYYEFPDEGSKKSSEKAVCYCHNCFYGRTPLANYILELLEKSHDKNSNVSGDVIPVNETPDVGRSNPSGGESRTPSGDPDGVGLENSSPSVLSNRYRNFRSLENVTIGHGKFAVTIPHAKIFDKTLLDSLPEGVQFVEEVENIPTPENQTLDEFAGRPCFLQTYGELKEAKVGDLPASSPCFLHTYEGVKEATATFVEDKNEYVIRAVDGTYAISVNKFILDRKFEAEDKPTFYAC
jgi:hypothetical protein